MIAHTFATSLNTTIKTTLETIMLTAVLTMAWGCSSSSDDNGNPERKQSETEKTFIASDTPQWLVDWSWNDPAPDWTEPDPSLYESFMYYTFHLEQQLFRYSTDDDLMAIFISGECRGVSQRNVVGDGSNQDILFTIIVSGNPEIDESSMMEVRYYSGGMKQIISYSTDQLFEHSGVMDEKFELTYDTPKYQMGGGQPELRGTLPFTVSSNDIIGVFVGDECRGTAHPNEFCHVWMRQGVESETFQLRYYSAQRGGYYTSPQTITRTKDNRSMDLIISFE